MSRKRGQDRLWWYIVAQWLGHLNDQGAQWGIGVGFSFSALWNNSGVYCTCLQCTESFSKSTHAKHSQVPKAIPSAFFWGIESCYAEKACKFLSNLDRGISLSSLGESIFRLLNIIVVGSPGLSKGTTPGSQEKLNSKVQKRYRILLHHAQD